MKKIKKVRGDLVRVLQNDSQKYFRSKNFLAAGSQLTDSA